MDDKYATPPPARAERQRTYTIRRRGAEIIHATNIRGSFAYLAHSIDEPILSFGPTMVNVRISAAAARGIQYPVKRIAERSSNNYSRDGLADPIVGVAKCRLLEFLDSYWIAAVDSIVTKRFRRLVKFRAQ